MSKLIGFIVVIIGSMLCCSCSLGVGTTVTYHNSQIDKDIQEKISQLNAEVIGALKNSNLNKLTELECNDLKKGITNQDDVFAQIKDSIADQNFEEEQNYLCKINKVGNYTFTLMTLEEDPYIINLQATSKQIFVSLLKTNTGISDYLLSIVYILEDNNWRLQTINISDYSFSNLTAIGSYEKAKELENKGQIFPATVYAGAAQQMLTPAPFIRYKNENEIVNYVKHIVDLCKQEYSFPAKVSGDSNAQEIYGFDVKCLHEGIVPVIKYITSLSMENGADIEEEARNISDNVFKMYPGLKENFDYFLFEAYSEYPVDPQKEYKCYRAIVKSK